MDSHMQDQYIQKKLLYKFDKKLDLVQQEYLKRMFPDDQNPNKITDKELTEEINNLEFVNFKYKTALLSSNKDLIRNQQEILEQDSQILALREQIKSYQEELQRAAIIRQNKVKFNQTGIELMKYDKTAIIDQKLQKLKNDIKEIDDKYNEEMASFQSRERYLKASLSALELFLREYDKSKEPKKEGSILSNDKEGGDDDGQVY